MLGIGLDFIWSQQWTLLLKIFLQFVLVGFVGIILVGPLSFRRDTEEVEDLHRGWEEQQRKKDHENG